jgi:type IV pilus assembly protein PilM
MRFPQPFRAPIVGLDIGSDAVKAVVLRRSRRGWSLVGAAEAPMPDAGTSDPDATADVVRQVLDTLKVRRARVVAALAGQSIIVKRLSLPAMSQAELAEAIPWEAEQYIPFDLADVQLDYQVLPAGNPPRPGMEVLLVAGKKDRIEDRADVIVRSGRQPIILDVEPFALANAYQTNHPDRTDPLTILVHVGRHSTIACLLAQGEPAFTRDIAIGGQAQTEALVRELGIDAQTAEKIKFGNASGSGVDPDQAAAVLRDVSQQLVAEIGKSIDFYKATAPVEKVSRLVLSGGGWGAEGLSELLAAEFDAPVEVFDPFLRVDRSGKRPAGTDGAGPVFAVAVGLAMREEGRA